MRTESETPGPLIIQVLPPGRGGVFDYLQCLKTEWDAQGISSYVIALSKKIAAQRSLAERIAEHQTDALQSCSVVLHFSGYGFGQRGICFWLLGELRALRTRRRGGLRLIVVFHELFASGPPWRSAFWLSRVQALIAARLARMADVLWTNTEEHAQWLRAVAGSAEPVHVRPVFSNIGEPERQTRVNGRRPVAVIFGSASTRQRVFDELPSHEAKLRQLGIEELVEVGNGTTTPGKRTTIALRRAARLEPAELCRLLQDSRFALLDYPSQLLGKSGVFAAYAAHGCVVLNTRKAGSDVDRLTAGSNYLSLAAPVDAAASTVAHEAIATRLVHWYADHALPGQAQELLGLCEHRQRAGGAAGSTV